jgi:hypothetical protein
MPNQNRFEDVLTKEFLTQRYIIEGNGTVQIGKEVGCSDMTVARYMRLHDIQLRKKGKPANDLTDKRFGMLTAIRSLGRWSERDRSTRWVCRCDCGNITEVRSTVLVRGYDNVTSCGCKLMRSRSLHPNWKGGRHVPFRYWDRVINLSAARGIIFDLTLEQADALLEQQGFCCALSGIHIGFGESARHETTASLDRRDNSLGYTPENVWWVHKDINRMKWGHSQEYFIRLCEAVVTHTKMYEEDKSGRHG